MAFTVDVELASKVSAAEKGLDAVLIKLVEVETYHMYVRKAALRAGVPISQPA